MREIEQYWIVEAGSASHMSKLVTDYMSEGWRPVGGLSVIDADAGGPSGLLYSQAMVRTVAMVADESGPGIEELKAVYKEYIRKQTASLPDR